MEVEDDGSIVLTPAVVLSKAELALLNRPEILESIEKNRAAGLHGRRGRPARDQ